MKRKTCGSSTDQLNDLILLMQNHHNLDIRIYEDYPGSYCTDDIPVNGQITLGKKKSYICLFTESIKKYKKELVICLLHEFGHHLHFEECDRDHDEYYESFKKLEREFVAWEYALSCFDDKIIPEKFKPDYNLFKYMMDVCMDDYKLYNK